MKRLNPILQGANKVSGIFIIDIIVFIVILAFIHIFTNLHKHPNRYIVAGTFSLIMTIALLPTTILSINNICVTLTFFLFSIICLIHNNIDKSNRLKHKIPVYNAQHGVGEK